MNASSTNKLNIFRQFHRKGFFHLLSANILIQIVAFASQLFVAGILLPDDIGRIKIIQTYLSVFSIIAGMGFNTSVLKLCSENSTPETKKCLLESSLLFTIISSVSLYFIIIILNLFGVFSSDNLIKHFIPIGLFPMISNSVFMVFIAYFQAIKDMKLISKLTASNKFISIIGIIMLTYWFGIKGFYMAYNVSFLLMLVVCFKIYSRSQDVRIFKTRNFSGFSTVWKYAKSSILANLFSEMSAYIDILLIGFFIKDMQQVGYYSFALTITVILRLFPGTVQQMASPYFSSLSDQKENFSREFKKYNKLLSVAVIVSLGIVLILMPHCIQWVFNGKYDQSMIYFPWLAIGWSLRQLAQLQSAATFGLGKIHYNAYVCLYSLLFNIASITVAIILFGLNGAAYASVLNGVVFALSSGYFYKRARNEIFS